MSNTKKGDALRDEVYRIVKSSGCLDCEKEKLIGGKKVDVYYEEYDHIYGSRKIGIECKAYSHPLGNNEINKICQEYFTALNNDIELLIIISIEGITTQGIETLKNYNRVIHKTFSEYASSFIDFSSYIRDITFNFNDDSLNSYYIPATNDSKPLLDKIDNWVQSENFAPIAILAGYGMGKSSFASYLANFLALKIPEKQTLTRIPLLIKLGGLTKEQSISGLISKHLSSDHQTKGYSYKLFRELNRLGFFVLIFDGFDEMKFGMNVDDFKSNISEINSLVEGKAKVIILGRPNAFLSEDEKRSVLNGIKANENFSIKHTNTPDYLEYNLEEFTNIELLEFSQKYLKAKTTLDKDSINEISEKLLNSPHVELFYRPVHARMICDIASHDPQQLGIIDLYNLYKIFIEILFEREYQKDARKKVSTSTRWEILQKIAWHLWKNKGAQSFTSKEIPLTAYQDELSNHSLTPEQMLREVLIGSFIDTKGQGKYYFSHRSFQEFLVAKHILENSWSANEIPLLSDKISDEIYSFIVASNNHKTLQERLFPLLENYNGLLSKNIVKILTSENSCYEDFTIQSAWQHFIRIERISTGTPHDSVSFIRDEMTKKSIPFERKVAILYYATLNIPLEKEAASRSIADIVGFCLLNSSDFLEQCSTKVNKGARSAAEFSFFSACLAKSVTSKNKTLEISFKEASIVCDILNTCEIFIGSGNMAPRLIQEDSSERKTYPIKRLIKFLSQSDRFKESEATINSFFRKNTSIPQTVKVEKKSIRSNETPERSILRIRKQYLEN